MRSWHICPKWQLAIGAAAKCGSTMLADLIWNNAAHRLPVKDARHGRECWSVVPSSYRKVFIVRHPVDRFRALYANVQQRKREPGNFYKQLEGHSPWAFLHKLLELSPDLMADFHFQPQHTAKGVVDAELVRLEAFNDWWQQNYPDAIAPRVLNTSTHEEIDDATAEAVVRRYEIDLGLWEKAWDSSTSSAPAQK